MRRRLSWSISDLAQQANDPEETMQAHADEDVALDAAHEVQELEVTTQPFHADDHNEEHGLDASAATTTQNAAAPQRYLLRSTSGHHAGPEVEEEDEEEDEEEEVR
jgi:hypothetical protein